MMLFNSLFEKSRLLRRNVTPVRGRRLCVESLENRELLSVNPLGPMPANPVPEEQVCQCVFSAADGTAEVLEGATQESFDDDSGTFALHSNPGSNFTIYLDFTGHTTTDTYWNRTYNNNEDIVSPAFSLDDDPAFSEAELERIRYIWQRVAEDYAPFDVDVTTEEPDLDRLIKSGDDDSAWGIRVVIGGRSEDWYSPGRTVGGAAIVGSFNDEKYYGLDISCFIFANSLANGAEKNVAEAVTHEVGHTLGLQYHHGTSTKEYYSGNAVWAPIMGSGYSSQVVQWNNGDYPDANNADNDKDDLAVITTRSGFTYRADDHGDTIDTATALEFSSGLLIGSGIIEQSTDVDFFSFSLDAFYTVDVTMTSGTRDANLDILANLYGATGELIASSNPEESLDAAFLEELAPGTYYIGIEGTGREGYYSDYGSLGTYTIELSAEKLDIEETPSTVVTTDLDVIDIYDGLISFREALLYAEAGDTVTFAESMAGATLLLDTENYDYWSVGKDLTIDAAGMCITLDADGGRDSVDHYRGIANFATTTIIGLTVTGLTRQQDAFDCGGAFYNEGNLTLIDCYAVGNYTIGVNNRNVMTLINTVVAGNHTLGLHLDNFGADGETASTTIVNSTIVDAITANWSTGADPMNLTIENSIVDRLELIAEQRLTIRIANSLISRYDVSGTDDFVTLADSLFGDFDNPLDPGFVDDLFDEYGPDDWTPDLWRSRDLRLHKDSPAVNAGKNDFVPADVTTDISGGTRILYGAVDMGAYEYDGTFKPDAPTNFSVTADGDDILLAWDAVDRADYYHVWRLEDNVWVTVERGVTELTVTDQGAAAGSGTYAVKAHNEAGYSDISEGLPYEIGVPKVTVAYDPVDGGVELTWSDIPEAEFYRVWRWSGDDWVVIARNLTELSFLDENAPPNEEARYVVRAFVSGVYSDTEIVSIVTAVPPAAPVVSAVWTGGNSVALSWDAVLEADSYRVWRKIGNGEWSSLPGSFSETAFIDNAAPPDTEVSYAVRAYVKSLYGKFLEVSVVTGNNLSEPEGGA